jgi:hypothetical protein
LNTAQTYGQKNTYAMPAKSTPESQPALFRNF